MDWGLAIHRNRTALLAVVAAIGALLQGAGVRDGAGMIARKLHNAALALLRPAESAARRLILLMARGLVLPARRPPALAFAAAGRRAPPADRAPAFRLFDRTKRLSRVVKAAPPAGIPRIRTFWGPPTPPPEPAARPALRPAPSPLVEARRLGLRLAALQHALVNLPQQARRLARWRAQRPLRLPLRPGRPPGWRADGGRDVDRVLRECHALALDALADTS